MKNNTSKSIGTKGEAFARVYFEREGFVVLACNYRHKRFEIDLIVQKENLLVFVEVKRRNTDFYGCPETFVTPEQRERVTWAADAFIHSIDWRGDIRFDIVAITDQPVTKLCHFKDAFF